MYNIGTVTLNNGVKMPKEGSGCFRCPIRRFANGRYWTP